MLVDLVEDDAPPEIAARLSEAVPRYTSYPTAPHFHAGVTNETYQGWLVRAPAGSEISLYIHVPFCDRLCWFCACHTKQILRYGPLSRYLWCALREIETVGSQLGPARSASVRSISAEARRRC